MGIEKKLGSNVLVFTSTFDRPPGVTVYIIVRTIGRMRKGESSCCGNCTESKCDCTNDK